MNSKITRASVVSHVLSCVHQGSHIRNRDEVAVPCPQCGDEEHFSFNVQKGRYNCYKCGLGGTVISDTNLKASILKIRKLSGYVLVERVEEQKKNTTSLPFIPIFGEGGIFNSERKEENSNTIPADTELIVKQAIVALKYCRKRKLSDDQIAQYRISLLEGEPRIYFPYWNNLGQINFYSGRLYIENTAPKTIEPVDAEKPLFGRHVKRYTDKVILVEGIFDKIATPCSYAVMGSSITKYQINTLKQDKIKHVYICFDPDAQFKTMKNVKILRTAGIKCSAVLLNTKEDPDKLGSSIMESIVNSIFKLDIPTICVDCSFS